MCSRFHLQRRKYLTRFFSVSVSKRPDSSSTRTRSDARKGQNGIAAVSFWRVPPRSHCSDVGIPLWRLLPASFVGRSQGKLGSVGDMLRGGKTSSCLKRRARMCRSCSCEQMFARWACLLQVLTARTNFMNYSVLTSEAGASQYWRGDY